MIKKENSNNNSKTNNNIIKNNECPILKNSENNLVNKITNYNTKKIYFNNKLKKNNFNFITQENFSNKKGKYINTTLNSNALKRHNFLKPNRTEINMEFGLNLDYNDDIKKDNNSSKKMNKILEYSSNSYNLRDNKGINKGINHKNLIIRINNRYENNNNNYIQNYIKKNKYNGNTNNYCYNNKEKIENKNQSTENIIKIDQSQEYFNNLKSKLCKKALEQFYKRIIKYCHLFLKNDFSLILFTIKNFSRNKFQPKTYKKKSIFNKNIFLSSNNKKKEQEKNVLSPLKNFNLVKMAKLKFDEKNKLTSGNKKNDTNILDEKESYTNSIQSNKSSNLVSGLNKNKSKFFSEIKNDIYIKKNNLKSKKLNNKIYISPRKKSKCVYNSNRLNNEYYNIYAESNPIKNKNIYDLNKTKDLKAFSPDKSQFFNSNTLIIDNKNSFNYLNKSANTSIPKKSKRKNVIKIKENKNKNKIEINKEELKLKKKKKYFNFFINKLRNITFCFHMNKIFSISKSNNIKHFFNCVKEIKNEKEQIRNISKEEKLNDYNNINSKDNNINIKELSFNDNENNKELFEMNEKENNINDLNMVENNIENNIENKIENNINKKENETIDINKENENYPLKKEESFEINLNKYENIINNNKININENENNIIEKEYEHKDELKENLKQMNSDDIIIEEKKENIINKNDSIDSLNNINDKNNELNKNDNVIDNLNSSLKKENEIIPDININSNNINDESNDNKKSLDLIDMNENNKIEENIKKRNLLMNKIIINISSKVNNVLNKKFFNIWKDIKIEENIKNIDNDNNIEIIKEPENGIKIENDEKINSDNNNKKAFFGDDVNDEEKKVILDEILQRFKILLIEFHLKNSQNISDSCELFLDDK